MRTETSFHKAAMPDSCGGDFWATTCYFNPVGYKRRRENYRLFRQRLAVPLVTVELSYNGSFELRSEDADMLVQIQGRDVMWQKERLLNLALQKVPGTCHKIAWLDCDVVFESDDWVARASRALEEFPLVHLFQERCDLPRNGTGDRLATSDGESVAPSILHRMSDENADADDLLVTHPGKKVHHTCGLAWACRRTVLARHGLYDAYVLGGGDRGMLCAALGKFECATRAARMNARREAHYLAWARPFHDSVRGRVGYVPGRLFHLWHGDLVDRQYEGRHRGLAPFEFDPFTDIAVDANGCWRWSSDKKEMHEFVRRYFESRKEDGA